MALLPGTFSRAGPLSTDIFDLQVHQPRPDARVVTVTGEVDALTAPELAAFLIEQLVAAPVVVVNLDGVRFLGSAGLSALVEVAELATREDRVLRLVCNSHTANWALATTGLRERFTFADTVTNALQNSPLTECGARSTAGQSPLHDGDASDPSTQRSRVTMRHPGRGLSA